MIVTMKTLLSATLVFLAALALSGPATAQLSIRDDLNRMVVIKSPAKRVVTLAPFLTELLYEAGAGDLAVGVDEHSDYPPQVFSVPKVKTGAAFAIEQLVPLKPDLVLAWRDGIRRDDVEKISGFGTMVFVASARQLEDVPRLLEAIATLTGRNAGPQIASFEEKIDKLRRANAAKPKLSTFLEIWNRPLTTVSGENFLSEALEICKGENVFADRRGTAPKVSFEDLATKDPYVIVGSGSASGPAEFRANWQLRPSLSAVKADRLVYIIDDTITRPGPRTPEGIANLCAELDGIRAGQGQRVAGGSPAASGSGSESPSRGFTPSHANPVPPPSLFQQPMTASQPKPAAPEPPKEAPKAEPVPVPVPSPAPAQPAAEARPERPKQFGL
jgi:iron complex transport system substrate-binding protein